MKLFFTYYIISGIYCVWQINKMVLQNKDYPKILDIIPRWMLLVSIFLLGFIPFPYFLFQDVLILYYKIRNRIRDNNNE